MSDVRIGSLCSGYGGLDEGVRSVVGGEVAWHSEIDPHASAILTRHWPDVPNLGDLSALDFHDVEPVDVVCAGFPCTDLSLAGRRAGIAEGTRSGLWLHVARAISFLRPSLVVIENVRGILSTQAHSDMEPCPWCLGDTSAEPALRALGAVLGDLAGLGFDAEWASVRASEIGAPHQRERVFVVAWPADTAGAGRQGSGVPGRVALGGGDAAAHADGERGERARTDEPARGRHLALAGAAAEDTDLEPGLERGVAASGQAQEGRARAESGRRGRAPAADADCGGFPRNANPAPGRGTVRRGTRQDADGRRDAAPHAPGERRHQGKPEPEARGRESDPGEHSGPAAADSHGDAVWQQSVALARRFGTPLVGADCPGAAAHALSERPRIELRDSGGESGAGASGLPVERDDVDWGAYAQAVGRWERLTRPAPRPTDDRGRLDPPFVEWLMGLDAGHVTGVPGLSRAAQLKALGNGVVPQQAAAALRLLLDRINADTAAAA
ncbi:DNA cytosine methyltransferase [Streptomyces sp. NA04227]|nr:DNA cytosine methyltransferase [Streptomyces sp. NA04227]